MRETHCDCGFERHIAKRVTTEFVLNALLIYCHRDVCEVGLHCDCFDSITDMSWEVAGERVFKLYEGVEEKLSLLWLLTWKLFVVVDVDQTWMVYLLTNHLREEVR